MTDVGFDLADLELRPLSGDCPRGVSFCGDHDIDRWFSKKSHAQHSAFDCRVTTVHAPGDPHPIAMYALAWVAEPESYLPNSKKSKSWFPALHLKYLAVRKDHQGRKVGPWCLGRILDLFVEAGEITAAQALTLVALDDRSEAVYAGAGFAPYARHIFGAGRRMLLPLQTALDLREKALTAAAGEAEERL